jgi:hypothetical protein
MNNKPVHQDRAVALGDMHSLDKARISSQKQLSLNGGRKGSAEYTHPLQP